MSAGVVRDGDPVLWAGELGTSMTLRANTEDAGRFKIGELLTPVGARPSRTRKAIVVISENATELMIVR